MADVQDFGAFLRHAMNSAGYPTAADLARATGLQESLISRWLRGKNQPTLKGLRPVADALKVPLLHLLVAAGHITAIEAGLQADPTPPGPPPTVEDDIRADAYLSDDKKEALIQMIAVLRAENPDQRDNRRRREA